MIPARLHINFFGARINYFHFFGVLGYTIGVLLGVCLSHFLNLRINIILLMSLVGAAVFFLLAVLAKIITREETIVYYHHEIAILLFCVFILRLLHYPILQYIDITVLGIGTFLAFGRLGCYSVGCCHGRPHEHGVKYGQQHVEAGFTWYYKDVPLLPVQLIESAYVFAIVIIGSILLLNQVAPGTVLISYTVIYGLMRYLLEFLRGDAERPLWLGLSEAQWTTLVLVGVTFGMSMIGWLPQYAWHPVILIIIVLISTIIILFYRRKEKYVLFSPPHIKQVAEGLNVLGNTNSITSVDSSKAVNIYTTRAGLCLSCGYYSKNNIGVRHYTVSLKNTSVIKKRSAQKMAQLIGLLKKHSGGFEIIEKQNGIYHILFTDA